MTARNENCPLFRGGQFCFLHICGDWTEYRQAMVTDQRCLVKFHVHRAGPNHSG